MKYPWLYVGAKVVCVSLKSTEPTNYVNGGGKLTLGTTYTVREIFPWKSYLYVRLTEVLLEPVLWSGVMFEPVYGVSRFRPLIDTTHQVTEMVELMKRARKTQSVDA